MVSRSYTICTICRKAWRGGQTCNHETIVCMHSNWRPPKRKDTKAWDRIAQGDYMTEISPLDIRSRDALPPINSKRFIQYWGNNRFNIKKVSLKGKKH